MRRYVHNKEEPEDAPGAACAACAITGRPSHLGTGPPGDAATTRAVALDRARFEYRDSGRREPSKAPNRRSPQSRRSCKRRPHLWARLVGRLLRRRRVGAGRLARVAGVFLLRGAHATKRENQRNAQGQNPKCIDASHVVTPFNVSALDHTRSKCNSKVPAASVRPDTGGSAASVERRPAESAVMDRIRRRVGVCLWAKYVQGPCLAWGNPRTARWRIIDFQAGEHNNEF